MTLVATINGPETIWVLADRRLSSGSRVVREDARKVMFLEATDGVAILGYCGLGATGQGNEPSNWMSAVLRGRNLPLEQSLGVIADAMKEQFPRHARPWRTPAQRDRSGISWRTDNALLDRLSVRRLTVRITHFDTRAM